MNYTDLPPLPRVGETGPQVCNTVRLYLAVLNDLAPEQVDQVLQHVSTCASCTAEFHLMNSATRLVAGLPMTIPSPRVDAAIMALQTAGNGARSRKSARRGLPPRRATWLIGQLAVAAVLLIALLTATHFSSIAPGVHQSFQLPANLSWSSYVVYQSERRVDANGMVYHVNSYYELGADRMQHVETVADGQLDVVAVGDQHAMLGKDMIHHVAQWGADAWGVDDSLFDLGQLRHDLQTKAAVFLDKENFRGQEVYSIREKNDLVLLLDMDYMPVNVLQGATGSGSGEPMYDTFKVLPASQVSSSMWDMSVPAGFQMGRLPAKP
jgi:hypothetical protein